MKFETCEIKGLIICKPKIINDKRGFFTESFRKDLFDNFTGEISSFCQTNCSESNYGTIRGLHFQISPSSQSKLVSVQRGEILDVVLDLRRNSKTYGKHFKIILSEKNGKHLFVPKGFAHGILGLDKENILHYACSNYRDPKSEVSIKWDDADLKIIWGIKKPIISKKDSLALSFREFKRNKK